MYWRKQFWQTRLLITAVLAALLISVWSDSASAVVLDDENMISVTLSDGTPVILYGEATSRTGRKSRNYYYLPTNLRLALRPDKVPEFLFMKYVTEERADQGGVSGALMHFLMVWGLTPEQRSELERLLEEKHKGAKLMGAVQMAPDTDSGSFQIISATMTDKGMTPSLVTSGKAPLMEGGKVAAAARLDKHGAQLMAASFEKTRSITDLSIALNFMYITQMPAVKGRAVLDWSRFEKNFDQLKAKYEKKRTGTRKKKFFGITFSSTPTYSYSYDEMRSQYDFLAENKIITLQFDEMVADERVTKIREAFFQYFLNAFTEQDPDEATPPKPDEKEKQKNPNIRYGNSYKYTQTFSKTSSKKKKQVFSLNYRLAIKRSYQLVGNLMSWYDAARNNPKCVNTINLNDPFFQHRDIIFVLDLDSKDMFEDAINYVTVNVRKRRSEGNPFEDSVTINTKYIAENGITASMTYARGEDRDPEAYEYKAQWSLKGGNLYPSNPNWEKGSWEGVTLAPPVVTRLIELEGDLDEMKSSGITRITAQIHYPQFGKEEVQNIKLSPAQKKPLVSKKIYVDRESRGYVYRLVVNHKTEGKLVLPWSAQVGDNYIYAVLPPDLLVEGEVKAAAKKLAEDIVDGAKEKILDKYKDVL